MLTKQGHYSFGAHSLGHSPSFPKSSIPVKERREVKEKAVDNNAAEKTAKPINTGDPGAILGRMTERFSPRR